MEHIGKRIIENAVQERLGQGLRILGKSNDDTHAASVAYEKVPSSDKQRLLEYVASLIHHYVRQHYERELRGVQLDRKSSPPEVPAHKSSAPDAPDALEALGALINATGWTSQRVVDEAVTFLWKAMQHSAMSAAE
jgi:hypothetical protein